MNIFPDFSPSFSLLKGKKLANGISLGLELRIGVAILRLISGNRASGRTLIT